MTTEYVPVNGDPLARFGPVLAESTGSRVARLRERADLTTAQLADACGRSASWVRKVESDSFVLDRLSVLVELARALGVEPMALIHTALRDLTR